MAVLGNSAEVFSRDEASMEWSGVELRGGQKEKQREGGKQQY